MLSKFENREFSNFEVFISTILSDFEVKVIDGEEFQVLKDLKFQKSKIFKNMKFPIVFRVEEMVNEKEYENMIYEIRKKVGYYESDPQRTQSVNEKHFERQREEQQATTGLQSTPFTSVGSADLDPTGRLTGNSGGMIVGPEHPMFTERTFDDRRHFGGPGREFMPGRPAFGDPGFMPGNPYSSGDPFGPGRLGNPNNSNHPGYMPAFPSHPPGARFDPVSPLGSNPSFPNRPMGRGQGRGRGGISGDPDNDAFLPPGNNDFYN